MSGEIGEKELARVQDFNDENNSSFEWEICSFMAGRMDWGHLVFQLYLGVCGLRQDGNGERCQGMEKTQKIKC